MAKNRPVKKSPPSPDRGSISSHAPILALIGILLLHALAMLYPSSAYPLHGSSVGFGFLLVEALALIGFLYRVKLTCWPRWRPAVPITLLVAGLWMAWWALRLAGAPVPPAGYEAVVNHLLGGIVFIATFLIVQGWEKEDFGAELPEGHIAPDLLMSGWLTWAIGIIAAFGVYQVLGPEGWPRTYKTLEQELLQTLSPDDPMREGLLHAVREGRASGTIGAANIFAGFCAFALPLAAACLLAIKSRLRWGFAVAGVVLAAGLLLSGSRGGLLAALFGIVLFAMMLGAWKWGFRRFLVVLPATIGALVLLVALLLLGLSIFNVGEEGSRWFGVTTVEQRIYYWATGWEIWSESFLTGQGPGAYTIFYPEYRVPGSGETVHAHNWLIEWGAEIGLVGLLLFALMAGLVGWAALDIMKREIHKQRFPRFATACGLTAGAAAILFHGLVDYTYNFREAIILAPMAGGFLLGWAGRFAPRMETPPKSTIGGLAIAGAAIPLVAAALVPWLLRPAQATLLRDRAGYLQEIDAPPAQILQVYDRMIALQPGDPNSWELRGLFYVQIGRLPRAERDIEQAIELYPQSARLRERLAQLYARSGRLGKAIATQREAVARHPLDAEHRLTLAEMLLRAGQEKEAREVLESTLDLHLGEREKERQRILAEKLDLE